MGTDSVGITARDISLELYKNRLYKYLVGMFTVYLIWGKAETRFGLLRSFPSLRFCNSVFTGIWKITFNEQISACGFVKNYSLL